MTNYISEILNLENKDTVYKSMNGTITNFYQCFKLNDNISISNVIVRLKKTGTVGSRTIECLVCPSTTQDITTAEPDTNSYYWLGSTGAISLTDDFQDINFAQTTSDGILQNGMLYWLFFRLTSYTDIDASNYISIAGSNNSTYSNGFAAYKSGSSIINDSRSYDLYFSVKGSVDYFARKNLNLFCGDIPASNNIAVFGSLKNSSIEYSSALNLIQQYQYWLDGIQSTLMSNNAPALQDFNALFYTIIYALCSIFQKGFVDYSDDIEYTMNSLVNGGNYGIYKSISNSNTDSLDATSKWLLLFNNNITLISASYTINYYDEYILFKKSGTVTQEYLVTIPVPESKYNGRTIVIKYAHNEQSTGVGLYIRRSDDGLISGTAKYTVSPWRSVRLICDGIDWVGIPDYQWTP